MKTFITLLFGFVLSGQSATVIFSVTNWNGTTPTNYIRISQSATPAITTNAPVTIGPPVILYPRNGMATNNMLAGTYRLEIQGVPNTVPILFQVPTGSGTYQVTDLIPSSVVIPGPTLGYTQTAANSKFVIRTNAVFEGSTNAFRFTNGVTAGQFLTTDGTNWFAVTVAPGAGLTAAITSINGDTNAAQVIATDETGTDFAIATASGTSTLSLPIASSTKTGKLSSTDWSTFNSKQAGSANLTAWSAIATSTKQPASDNLTNWSAIATSTKQPASDNLTNWSALATSAKQDHDTDLDAWAALATSSKQDALGYTPVNRAGDTMSAGGLTNRFDGFVGNGNGLTNISESSLSLSDNTTANGTTNRHGLLPKLPNDSTKYLDGTGAYTTPPSGSGTVSSVAVTADSDFQITGSPIMTSGTINLSNTNSTGSGSYVRKTSATLTAPTLSGPTISGSPTNSAVGATKVIVTDSSSVETGATLSGLTLSGGTLTRDALTGDVTTSGNAATIANNAVTDAKFRQGVARSVVGITGNATANTADIQGTSNQVLRVNGLGTALAFGPIDLSQSTGATGVVQAASFPALTGDVTTSAGSLATTIAANAVDNGKISTSAAIARSKIASGTASHIVVNDGSGNLSSEATLGAARFPALTGDVTTSAGALATTIANNAVTDAKFRQGSARTVVGVTGNSTANTADIQGTTDQVLRVNGAGTALGFGAIDLSKTAAASGVLQAASFPALTGDITTSAGALATTLKNTGTAGTYAGVTFDAQGRETSAVAFPAVVFVGNAQNLNPGTTGAALAFGAGSTAPPSWSAVTERKASVPIVRSGTFSNLTFKVVDQSTGNAFLGAGTNTTFILYTNAVATSFAFTLDGTTTTTNSGTSSLAILANTLVSWRITNQVSASLSASWSVELY